MAAFYLARVSLGVLCLGEHLHHLNVGGHPLQCGERFAFDPADIHLLGLLDFTGIYLAQEAVHREVEVIVVKFNGIEVSQVRNGDVQLFCELAHAGI